MDAFWKWWNKREKSLRLTPEGFLSETIYFSPNQQRTKAARPGIRSLISWPEVLTHRWYVSLAPHLLSVTLNGAAAIGRADRIGSLEPGKQADLLLWDAPDLDYVCYRFGSNLVHTVMKKGRLVG